VSWYGEMRDVYDLEEEKVERAAKVDVATGGRLTMPEPGEEVLVMFTKDLVKVESEKLREVYNIEETMFARVKIVKKTAAGYDVSVAEYDMPVGKSLAFNLAATCKKHGILEESLVGKVFLITANIVERDGRKQKMYRVAYKPDVTNALASDATAAEEFDEEIEL